MSLSALLRHIACFFANSLAEGGRLRRFAPVVPSPALFQSVHIHLLASYSPHHFFAPPLFFPSCLRPALAELNKNPIDLVSVGLTDESDVYDWEVMIMEIGRAHV